MSTSTATPSIPRLGDVLVGMILFLVFVVGYLQAQDWPFRAALFPQLLSALGLVFAVLKLVGFGTDLVRGRRTRISGGDEDGGSVESDQSDILDYAFGKATRRSWLAALGWSFGFFSMLWLLGVFITVPVYSFAYLRISGNAGWISSAIYALTAGGVVFVAFGYILSVPMPTGIF